MKNKFFKSLLLLSFLAFSFSLFNCSSESTTQDSSAKEDDKIEDTSKEDETSNNEEFLNSIKVTSVQVSTFYTGQIKVSWTDTSAESYSIKVFCNGVLDSSLTVNKIAKGVQEFYFDNLKFNSSYTFRVLSTSKGFTAQSAISKSIVPKVIIWQLTSGYGNRLVVQPLNADSTESKHLAALNLDDKYATSYWIVHPALSGNKDYFSLEAASTATGEGSGKYIYLDEDAVYTPYKDAWPYDGHDSPYALIKDKADISSDSLNASFKFGTSSNKEDWLYMISESGLKVTHNSLTYWGKKTETEDSEGCGDFKINEFTADSYTEKTDPVIDEPSEEPLENPSENPAEESGIFANISSYQKINESSSSYFAWTQENDISLTDKTSVIDYSPSQIISDTQALMASKSQNSFTLKNGSTYYAFSPSRALTSWNASVVSAKINARQNLSLNNSSSFMASSALSDGKKLELNFKPIASVIELDLSSLTVTADSVYIKANSGVNIAGDFTYNIDSSSFEVKSSESSKGYRTYQSDVIEICNLQGSSLVKCYLLPVQLKGGITVTVKDTDGNYYSKNFASDIGSSSSAISLSGILTNGQYTEPKVTVTACTPYSYKIDFGSQTDSDVKKNLWQAAIPSDTWFSMLSTPGSHDSATSGCKSSVSFSKCQMLTIQELLASGVRAFDLRPGYMHMSAPTIDTLYIYHGEVSTGVLYKDAVKTLVQFVIDNPTEAITVLQIKENSKPTITFSSYKDYSSEMWTIIKSVLNEYKSYIIDCDHSNFTLSDIRGKLLFLNRNGTDCPPMLMIKSWPDNNLVTDYSVATPSGRMKASVADCYNQTNTEEKLNGVKTLLNLSSSNTDKQKYHFTFVSIAASATNTIEKYVGEMNWNTSQFILKELTGPAGYVYGDYMGYSEKSGALLVKTIISQNFKYAYSGRSD